MSTLIIKINYSYLTYDIQHRCVHTNPVLIYTLSCKKICNVIYRLERSSAELVFFNFLCALGEKYNIIHNTCTTEKNNNIIIHSVKTKINICNVTKNL